MASSNTIRLLKRPVRLSDYQLGWKSLSDFKSGNDLYQRPRISPSNGVAQILRTVKWSHRFLWPAENIVSPRASPRQRSVSIPSLIPKPTSKPRNWKNTWVCRVRSLAVDLVQLETVSSLGPPSPIVCPGRRTKVRSIKRFYSSSTPGLDQIRYDKSYKTVGSNKGFREYVFSTGLQLPSETKSYIVSLKDRLRRPPGLVIERRWRLQARGLSAKWVQNLVHLPQNHP